ncbi:MAG: hypothetical protein ACREND_08415 [Gemmatimonadaceae bacterium]
MSRQTPQSLPPGDVEIAFTGLCLLAPRQSGGVTDVFLVNDSQHVSAIYVRTPGGTGVCTYGFSAPAPFQGDLDLSDFGKAGSGPTVLSSDIANITLHTQQRLDPAIAAQQSPNADVRARVILRGDRLEAYSHGKWQYNGGVAGPLAFCALWTIKNCQAMDALRARIQSLAGAIPLFQTGGIYRLLIVNVPSDELPNAPTTSITIARDGSPPHFDMYKGLLTPKGNPGSPVWKDETTTIKSTDVCLGEPMPTKKPFLIGSFIRCMIAQASS